MFFCGYPAAAGGEGVELGDADDRTSRLRLPGRPPCIPRSPPGISDHPRMHNDHPSLDII